MRRNNINNLPDERKERFRQNFRNKVRQIKPFVDEIKILLEYDSLQKDHHQER